MKKTIKGYNAQGAYHGYHEWYQDFFIDATTETEYYIR